MVNTVSANYSFAICGIGWAPPRLLRQKPSGGKKHIGVANHSVQIKMIMALHQVIHFMSFNCLNKYYKELFLREKTYEHDKRLLYFQPYLSSNFVQERIRQTYIRFGTFKHNSLFVHECSTHSFTSNCTRIRVKSLYIFLAFPAMVLKKKLIAKYTISMPLMMENPDRSPMVPPIRLSWASVLILLSLSILSKVAVSK